VAIPKKMAELAEDLLGRGRSGSEVKHVSGVVTHTKKDKLEGGVSEEGHHMESGKQFSSSVP